MSEPWPDQPKALEATHWRAAWGRMALVLLRGSLWFLWALWLWRGWVEEKRGFWVFLTKIAEGRLRTTLLFWLMTQRGSENHSVSSSNRKGGRKRRGSVAKVWTHPGLFPPE